MPSPRIIRRFEEAVSSALTRAGLDVPGTKIIVAASGGPDSTALLRSLQRVGTPLGIELHVAHLRHDLRGAETLADAAFVGHLARETGLPCTVRQSDPLEHRRQRGISSFEQATREVRYEFLLDLSRSKGATSVAVGHTMDDQAETVMEHLLRGSGLHGLRGMTQSAPWPWPPGAQGPFLFRPLLAVTKAQTTAYCRALGQDFRTDSENESPKFARNRIRHDLLPKLASEYNPRVIESLVRLSRTAATDLDYLESECDRIWPQVEIDPAGTSGDRDGGGLSLDRAVLQSLHPSLRRNVLRRAFALAAGDVRRLEETHLAGMDALVAGGADGRSCQLPRGWWLHASAECMTLTRESTIPCPLPPLSGQHPLELPRSPGEKVAATVEGWRVASSLVPLVPAPVVGGEVGQGAQVAYLDSEAIRSPVLVRTRKPGDRFQPAGMTGRRKLQDFFVDSKVPRHWRDRIPLLECAGEIAWVVGHRIAEWARAPSQPEPGALALRVEFTRQPNEQFSARPN